MRGTHWGARVQSAYRLQCRKSPTRELSLLSVVIARPEGCDNELRHCVQCTCWDVGDTVMFQDRAGIVNGDTLISDTAFFLHKDLSWQSASYANCNSATNDQFWMTRMQATQLILGVYFTLCYLTSWVRAFQLHILCVTQVSSEFLPNVSAVQHRDFLSWLHLFSFVNV